MFSFGPDLLHDVEAASAREWVLANGIGGYASSTITGLHTRRYHGLLIAGSAPLADRRLLVSKLSEGLCFGRRRYELDANRYPGVIYPEGYTYLVSVQAGGCVVSHTWEVDHGRLTRRVAMARGRNASAVVYSWEGDEPTVLELRPLMANRGYHHTVREHPQFDGSLTIEPGMTSLMPYPDGIPIHVGCESGEVIEAQAWYYNIRYSREEERGLDAEEDLFCPGVWRVPLEPGASVGLVFATEPIAGAESHRILREAEDHERSLLAASPLGSCGDPRVHSLLVAADSFLTTRDRKRDTVIAGYHWFLDWGRDSMIALPGLTLRQGRLEAAQGIVLTFAHWMHQGLIPNRFPDHGDDAPDYNTVDATLWMFVAAKRLAELLPDPRRFIESFWPAVTQCIDWHVRGTRYGIRVDEDDGLLAQGGEGHQLTWMDAKVGDLVFTPRTGKPVEIQALWYNALRIAQEFAEVLGKPEHAEEFGERAARVEESFGARFWLEEPGYLADVLTPEGVDASLRPNQLLAASLPYPLLSVERTGRMLEVVREKLLTPYGLRSLSPDHKDYRGMCVGGPFERDSAYHQGTVWAWLIGPYCRAYLRAHGLCAEATERVRDLLEPLLEHTKDAGVGSISEVFDGDAPFWPRGCVSQAWSVSEMIDVLAEVGPRPVQRPKPQLIRMDRADLGGLPPKPVAPDGFEVSTYSAALFDEWIDLLNECFPENAPFPREKWRERLVSDARFLPDGLFLVRDLATGKLCATAYAWTEGPDHPGLARVEWVGALPTYRGMGLGRLVTELVLHYMAGAGFTRVTLDTESFRVPAVGLYLSLGFTPTPRDEEEKAVWAEVVAKAEAG